MFCALAGRYTVRFQLLQKHLAFVHYLRFFENTESVFFFNGEQEVLGVPVLETRVPN